MVPGSPTILLRRIPGWAPAVALLLFTAVAGPALGGLIRPLFVLGCAATAWFAWRRGPEQHLQAVLWLFCFSPFVRRLVDVSVAYDASAVMLIGPMLAILVPAPELRALLKPGRDTDGFGPGLVWLGCVTYAALLSMVQADWFNAASGTIKWAAPVVYALVLLQRRVDPVAMAQAAARAFMAIIPIMGLYGVVQYIDPPLWDRFWMQYASITSAGYPVPYGVRVFSTMNGPASYATFTAAGLLLVGFLRPGWQAMLAGAPAGLGLLLSLYRTGWIALAAGVLFCVCFGATRRRSLATMAGIVIAAGVAATTPPFSDVIADRLETLTNGSKDGSGQERLDEYVTLWNLPDSALVGFGFTTTDAGQAGAMPIDGQIVASWITMGIVVGMVCLASLIWAATRAITPAWRDPRPEAVVLASLAVAAMTQIPLAGFSGELGFLFWGFAGIAIAGSLARPLPAPAASRRMVPSRRDLDLRPRPRPQA